ncbi:Rieske (2Fe-2S) protein [Gilvimarinus sp. F26214L]|uniref:Rieske (2Fe-2S) protein n=1 Tax=Gilvimarinus sp. DZF01 TaxID=3461371 RepID=UPI004045608A
MRFHPLDYLHRLHEGYQRAFVVDGQPLLLIQTDGRAYIVANQCPHMNAPLTHARIQDGVIRCPLHGFEYNLHSGRPARAAFEGGGRLQHFPVAYEGNQIGIYL